MRPIWEISDRRIIQIALVLWSLIAIGSLIAKITNLVWSAAIAIVLGAYGLRIMRIRQASEQNKSGETREHE